MRRDRSAQVPKTQLLITQGSTSPSQFSVHNYFASKMARFSQVMAFLTKKSEQTPRAPLFEKAKDKLTVLREDFLTRYHQLGRTSGGLTSQTERIKEIYELLQRFENAMLAEIAGTGLVLSGFSDFDSGDCASEI